jgi:hypothetical protein
VARAIKTEAAPDASLDYAEDVMDFDLRWNPDKYRPERRQPWGAAKEPRSGNQSRQSVVRAPVDTLLIDKRIALVTLPGEPFVDYQIDWRNRCPVHDAFFLGYANDSIGYLPTIRAAALGGYGAGNSATYVQPDAGARIVDRAIVRIYEMLGRLRDVPEDRAGTGTP